MKNKLTTRELCLISLFIALIAIGAFIKVPIPVLPFTLQFLFTTLAGLLLGGRNGAIAVLGYLALGLMGLPIFANGGGIGYVFNPSFGYLIGFAVGAYVTGKMTSSPTLSFKKTVIANFAGLFFVYLLGMVYYYVICNFYINTPIGLWTLFIYCFVLAIPGDILLCFISAIIAKRLRVIIGR